MPQLMTIRHRRYSGSLLRLYIPIVPVCLVLAPLLVLALIAGLIACRVHKVDPVGALRGAGRLLWALPGTRIEIEQGRTAFSVSVR
ncbi:hypothetical protein SLA_0474 [Streptomyces laurentii]|uniref:Uncharacterized protein n=2 Tax=Streptomyces laurentii TaxID=39478 RepID=A0A160NST0_STRLU|nr:hypothetical protein SLA_0474 [Streptomyces laurentii]